MLRTYRFVDDVMLTYCGAVGPMAAWRCHMQQYRFNVVHANAPVAWYWSRPVLTRRQLTRRVFRATDAVGGVCDAPLPRLQLKRATADPQLSVLRSLFVSELVWETARAMVELNAVVPAGYYPWSCLPWRRWYRLCASVMNWGDSVVNYVMLLCIVFYVVGIFGQMFSVPPVCQRVQRITRTLTLTLTLFVLFQMTCNLIYQPEKHNNRLKYCSDATTPVSYTHLTLPTIYSV